jgi:choice-of-anchor A domain-containing protein
MAKRFFLPVSCLLLLVSPLRADIDSILPLGDLGQWGAFSLGLNGPDDRLFNGAQLNGNIGVAGNGSITMAGSTSINGDVYVRPWNVIRTGSGTVISGSQNHGAKTLLDWESNLALNLSRQASLLAPTQSLSAINLSGASSLTLNGAPGASVVLNLSLFRMVENSTLTLQGSANTTYVINVNRGFSLTDAARIVLSGGLDWNDVLFNVRGRGTSVTLAGNSSFQGILLATRRTVQVRDAAIIRGEIVADNLWMQGTAQVNHPAVVSQ